MRLRARCFLLAPLALAWLSLLRHASAGANDASEDLPQRRFDPSARQKLDDDLSRLLRGPELAFCRDAREAAAVTSPELCRLARAPVRQRCPELERACSAAPPPARAHSTDRDGEGSSSSLPSAIGTVLFWGVLGLLVFALIRLLWPVFESLKPDAQPTPNPDAAHTAREPRAPRAAQESDVERLLAEAERAKTEGRFEHAINALYGALVHFLGHEQLITVEAARTNGDYLRELAPKPKLQAAVRHAFRAVERVQFGHGEPSAAVYRELWEGILPIVKRGAAVLALLFVPHTLGGCARHTLGDPEFGPRGHYLLTQLLHDSGTRVRRIVLAANKVDDEVSELLVFGHDVSDEAWSTVSTFADAGGSVIVTDPSPEILESLHVDVDATAPCTHALELELVPRADATSLSVVSPGERYLRLTSPEASGTTARVEASCDGRALVATLRHGEGYVTLLADPDFIGNASLSVADNALFTLGLFAPPGGTLGLVGAWTGAGAASPVQALRNAGLSPLLYELLAFLAILFWQRGSAFGARRDPRDFTRRAFTDHVRALGRNYARARARRYALGQYAAFTLETLRERYGRGAPLTLIDLAGELARRLGRRESDVMLLLTEAHEAAQDASRERGTPSDLATIEKLETLMHPTGGPK